ncbi:MAG: universal stress protein [Chitinophagaceae bacterium]|nr:universal stress protein [Chitinophagaceae bacterium]
MKRILVPTDFSPTAERAFRVALDISEKSGGLVILYHAYSPEKNQLISSAEQRELFNKQTEVNLVKKLQRLKKKVTKNTGNIAVSTVLGRSPVVDNILGFAEHNHIDLIVMGTQGASGLRKTIVGSVAAKVADHADIPVLLVPEKYEWKDPEHILFTSNYVSSDKQALAMLLDLAKLYKTGVTVIHLINAYLTATEKEKEKAAFDSYAYALQRECSGYKIKFKLLETSSFIETMENLDKNIPYDIVAMIRRNKSFYEKFFVGSFTNNMAYITKQLLLIIPQEMGLAVEKDMKKTHTAALPIPHDNLQIEKIRKRKPAAK